MLFKLIEELQKEIVHLYSLVNALTADIEALNNAKKEEKSL